MVEFVRDILLPTKSNLYYGLKCNILHDSFSLNKIGIKEKNNHNLFPPQGHLTLNPRVTKTEFLLTISIQYQADKR